MRLPCIHGQFIPTQKVHVSDAHSINTITNKTRFGNGNRNTQKTVAYGDIDLSVDINQINVGVSFTLKNSSDILTPSGRIYGTHPNSSGVYPKGNTPETVALNQAEFGILKKMIDSGGLKGDALKKYNGMINNNNPGISGESRQKLINLYNSRKLE